MSDPHDPARLEAIRSTTRRVMRALVVVVAVLVVWGVVGLLVNHGDEDPGQLRYEACEAAAQRKGLGPSSPDYLVTIGTCMERLEQSSTTR